MISKNKIFISKLSPHLFWDVNRNNIEFEKNKKFIIQRVLEYGFMSDWQIIYSYYGIDNIASTAATIKDLDGKSIAFIALLSKTPKEKFLCYTSMQSTPRHWNF